MYDQWIPRLGVAFLGVVSIITAIGGTVITFEGRDVPPFMAALGSAAVSTIGVVVIALTRPPNGPKPAT
jgi:hypothetical protein